MISDDLRRRYQEGGRIGGSAKVPKGFATNRDRAREAGRKGALKRAENLRQRKSNGSSTDSSA